MGTTAENVAKQYGITRPQQDEFSVASQNKAEAAQKAGAFKDEIVPVMIPQRKGDPVAFATDEFIKAGTTLESISGLRPAFAKEGSVTAANASGLNDGAAGVVVMAKPMRVIKKYPNRRLYDTANSGYITMADVKQMVLEFIDFQVIDAKSGDDLTRGILLQIILEEESAGMPMFSSEMLSQMIRFYGNALQGIMGNYMEQNVEAFLVIQNKLQDQAKQVYGDKMMLTPDLWKQFLQMQAPAMHHPDWASFAPHPARSGARAGGERRGQAIASSRFRDRFSRRFTAEELAHPRVVASIAQDLRIPLGNDALGALVEHGVPAFLVIRNAYRRRKHRARARSQLGNLRSRRNHW